MKKSRFMVCVLWDFGGEAGIYVDVFYICVCDFSFSFILKQGMTPPPTKKNVFAAVAADLLIA